MISFAPFRACLRKNCVNASNSITEMKILLLIFVFKILKFTSFVVAVSLCLVDGAAFDCLYEYVRVCHQT